MSTPTSGLHKFIFNGLPIRGILVQITDAWQEVLRRHQATKNYPPEVMHLLGEMTAAAVLLQSSISFNGTLTLQLLGHGPVKLAVVEVGSDLNLRATAKVVGDIAPGASFAQLVQGAGISQCVLVLTPKQTSAQQPQTYQSVVPLQDAQHQPLTSLAQVIEHYMRQSEQLDTQLVLAANAHVAAGLLVQRLPLEGEGNLQGTTDEVSKEQAHEDYNRIAILSASLQHQELFGLDADTVLHRLFWEEQLTRFDTAAVPHFFCSCSKQRVCNMLRSLGAQGVRDILVEQGHIEVGCEFCGVQYQFDAVDAAQIFAGDDWQLPPPSEVQ